MDKMTTDKFRKLDGTPDDIAIAGAVDVLSGYVDMSGGKSFMLSLKATVASGTPDLDIYAQQTHIKPADNLGAEAISASNGWAAIEGSAKLLDITDENWHHLTISPGVLPFIRLRASGQGTNPATCTLKAYLTQLKSFDF